MKKKTAVELLQEILINLYKDINDKEKKFNKKNFEAEARKVKDTFKTDNEDSLRQGKFI